jgi:hypothetical protein
MSDIGYRRDKAAQKGNLGLKFFPASHRYKLDGQWVPGVTTILGVLDKPAIPKWAAKSVAQYVAQNREGIEHLWTMGERAVVDALKGIPWEQRDQAGVRGTDVHDFAERILNGQEVDVPEHLVGHVESCIAFMEEWHIRPVLVEAAVGSREHSYGGKLDLVADSSQAPRAIFDWKTAASGIYKEAAFQLVAYAFADFHGENGDEKPMADLGIEESFGVHIRADGYDVYPLAYGRDVFEEFVTIRRAFDINKRANGDWKRPGTGYVGLAHQTPTNNNDNTGEVA